jgi:molecular chaperone Hsp33
MNDDQRQKFAYRNRNNIRDQVFSAISADGGIKVTAVTARNLLNDMMMKHTLTEVPTGARSHH